MTVIRKPKSGLAAAAVKVVAKFALPLLKASKLILAGASLAAYAWLFTWQFAVVIMAVIFVHEATHVLVMKHGFGMKVRGMYFLPFVGAVAVPEDNFPSRSAEAWTAFAGPLTGLVLGLGGLAVYTITHSGEVAAITAFIALINLFNLLPVNPLDGGRVVKSVAMSLSTRLGLGLMAALLAAGAAFAIWQRVLLFAIIIPFGIIDLVIDYRLSTKATGPPVQPSLPRLERAGVAGAYASLAAALFGIILLAQHAPGAQAALHALRG